MSDSYQAIYDAVRSRISGVNVGEIVAEACRQAFDISWMKASLQQDFSIAASEMARPCVVFKAILATEGEMWRAQLGDDLTGYGKTPAEAMTNFDQAFYKEKTPTAMRLEEERQTKIDNGQFGVGA
jgi:hypothetical protein